MNKINLDNIPVSFKLMPIEIMAQLFIAIILVSNFWTSVEHAHLFMFIGLITTINTFRILTHYLVNNSPDVSLGHSTDIAFKLGNFSAGLAWGCLPIFVDNFYPGTMSSSSLVFAALAAVTMATFAGSPLQPGQLSAFAVPALVTPLLWSISHTSYQHSLVWGLILMTSLVLVWASYRLGFVYKHYRNIDERFTNLVQQYASSRDEALIDLQGTEISNRELKNKIEKVEQAKAEISLSEQESNTILKDMQDMFFRTNVSGQIIRSSESARYLLGYQPNELIGMSWASLFVTRKDHSIFLNALREKFVGLNNYEVKLHNSSGEIVWVSINAHYYNDDKNIMAGFEGTVRDITEKRLAAENLFLEKERLHVTLESIADGVITTNAKGAVEYLNPNAEAMTGWIEKQAIGKPLATIFNLIDENKKKPVNLPMKKWLTDGKRIALNHPAVLVNKASQREFSIELTGAPIKDSSGAVTGTVLVFRNVTKLRNLATKLSHQATHDALTGLINRTEFEHRANQAIQSAQEHNKIHTLLYIDLDQFKIVNDTCGHHAGDELLRQLTTRMENILRESDTLARLGGDEFGVLLIGCQLEKAIKIAQTLRRSVEDYRFVWKNQTFKVGASIGLVMITEQTSGLTQLLSAADSACYVAKDRGRNQVHIYQLDDRAIAQQHGQMQWMQRIQLAIDSNQFELHYQSIINISNPVTGYRHGEFLLRMIDDQNTQPDGIIMPNAFIPAAQRYHLMPLIDRWVIKHVLYSLANSKKSTDDSVINFINLSVQSISDFELLDYVIEMIQETAVNPSCLCFEITESAVIANVEVAKQFITRLKDIGCHFALDNFGSGLGSFSYLKNLPVDFLKLDGSLIRDMATDDISLAMVESINRIAHVMGMKTIAEYVETEATLIALKNISVDYAQGFWIERPRFFSNAETVDEKTSCA